MRKVKGRIPPPRDDLGMGGGGVSKPTADELQAQLAKRAANRPPPVAEEAPRGDLVDSVAENMKNGIRVRQKVMNPDDDKGGKKKDKEPAKGPIKFTASNKAKAAPAPAASAAPAGAAPRRGARRGALPAPRRCRARRRSCRRTPREEAWHAE